VAIEGMCVGGPLDGKVRKLKHGNRLHALYPSAVNTMSKEHSTSVERLEYRVESIQVGTVEFHLFIPMEWTMEQAIRWILHDYARRRK
jgi:hypothetical protein